MYCSKYDFVVPIKGKTESDLAHGMIECFAKMGQPPRIVYTDGETGIRHSWRFQQYFNQHKITVHFARGHPAVAERFNETFKPMLDKRIQPGQDWTQHIYPIMLTYNNKLGYSTTKYTPKMATKQENEF